MTQLVKTLAISALVLALSACGEDDDGGGKSSNSGRPNTQVDVQNTSKAMTLHECKTTSRFASNHFIIGTVDSVDDNTLKNILRATQASFDSQLSKAGFDAYSDLGVDSESPLEICVDTNEGSNGAASGDGVIIGTGRTGANLDLLLDHELAHTIGDLLNKDVTIGDAHRWYNEGMATLYSDNGKVSRSDMQLFVSTGRKPVEIVNYVDGQMVAIQLGQKAYIEYPSYNTVLHFLKSQGASNADLWDVYKEMWKVEQSCRTQMMAAYQATKHLGVMNTVGQESYGEDEYACQSDFFPSEDFKTLYTTKYNGRVVGADNVFEVAFDEIISTRTGISYQNLVSNFDALVTNGYLN